MLSLKCLSSNRECVKFIYVNMFFCQLYVIIVEVLQDQIVIVVILFGFLLFCCVIVW